MDIIYTKYLRWYQNIVRRAYHRGKIEKPYNRHHIIPKSIQNQTVPIQILFMDDIEVKIGMRIYLTLKEHYIVHDLLVKIFEFHDKYCYEKMLYAWNRMSNSGADKSRDFVLFRKRHVVMMSVLKTGSTQSESGKQKIGDAHRGISLSPDHKNAISKSSKGRHLTKDHKRKIIETKTKNGTFVRLPASRAKMSKAQIGNTKGRGNKGNECSAKTRQAVSERHKGEKWSKERIEKRTKSRKLNKLKKAIVIQNFESSLICPLYIINLLKHSLITSAS